MVRIRLTRVGLKKQASYRIVIMDRESRRDSRYIESIGFYNPRTQPETVKIDEGRALYWLSVGAQPSDPVAHMLKKRGTFERLARLRQGESLEALAAEAQPLNDAADAINPKTRFPAPLKSAKKAAEAAE
jgi:small subunit ribosomal protein S16